MAKKRRQSTSPKYYLVRDFNFRMGNLWRIKKSIGALDSDIAETIDEALEEQMLRERHRHENCLKALIHGDPLGLIDTEEHLQTAVWRAARAAEKY
jgi:hypothetical protein